MHFFILFSLTFVFFFMGFGNNRNIKKITPALCFQYTIYTIQTRQYLQDKCSQYNKLALEGEKKNITLSTHRYSTLKYKGHFYILYQLLLNEAECCSSVDFYIYSFMFKGLRKQIVLNITASEEEYSTASLQ